MAKKLLAWFEEIDKHDVGLVGGKGANLGEMLNAKFPVPYGFVVTANAYFTFIQENNLDKKIRDLLGIINFENSRELHDGSKAIRKILLNSPIPTIISEKIIDYYDYLPQKEAKIYNKNENAILSRLKSTYKSPIVAVRSSATAEDLPEASFAGQQETYLNVQGENDLITKVRECWASLFTERAIYYRHNQGFDHFKVGLAAVVQRMIESEKSGIAFSIDPVTNNKSTIMIEAIYGLGEYIVQGMVTPDHYEVNKNTYEITNEDVRTQTMKFVKKGTSNAQIKLSSKEGSQKKLTNPEIVEIAKIVHNIEKHYFFPQDTEWAIENGKVYIVQARPITTIKATTAVNEQNIKTDSSKEVILKGDPASPGIAYGHPVVIASPKEIGLIQKGDVLVAEQTNPDYVPAMKKASAIVTEKGGRTSHAAIVSRELGIPAVVGAEGATKILKNQPIVTVNGKTGEVYKGNVLSSIKLEPVSTPHKKVKTLTKIYVNMAEPSEAERVAKLDVDGIGLLRAEFMIADIGTHPKEFIRQKKQDVFIQTLTKKLLMFAKAFAPRPIVYRATDFKTNEYKHLVGGEKYEPREENPMIGYRGASRYIKDPEVFAMELEAIKNVRAKGFKNINLMIPFIRVPEELIEIKEILKQHGLVDLPTFKLWIMVEVPATVIRLEEFLRIGIDGVSVGTNDLTMLLLGVDRDNEVIAKLYDERNPAVLWALEKIVKTTNKYGVTCSVCGQAPSDYPDIVEKLVGWGVTSMSLNPDAVDATRQQVHEIETKLWQKLKK
jgi:pyruvate,water dikinase